MERLRRAGRVNGVGHHIQPSSRPTYPESTHISYADGECISYFHASLPTPLT
jgi:hypothetical protein